MPSRMINGQNYHPPRTATYVVAASDAPAHVKAQADYVCDGVDDQVEINTYIALGNVLLSPGTFRISDSILVDVSTRQLIGSPDTEILDTVYIHNLIVIQDCSNVHLKGFHLHKIHGSGAATHGGGIFFLRTNYCTASALFLEGTVLVAAPWDSTPTWGIYGDAAHHLKLLNCHIIHCGYEGMSFWRACRYGVMGHNTVDECGFGLVVEREGGDHAVIVGNTVSNSKGSEADILVRSNRHTSVVGNAVYAEYGVVAAKVGIKVHRYANSTTVIGNVVAGYAIGIQLGTNAHGSIVEGNAIYHCANGVEINNAHGNIINGNFIQYTGSSAIWAYLSQRNHISNNVCVCNEDINFRGAIALQDSSYNTVRQNNIAFGMRYGIRVQGTSPNNAIEGNLVADDYALIQATLGDNTLAGDDEITINGAPCNLIVGLAITVDDGGANPEDVTITDQWNPGPLTDTEYPRTFRVTPLLAHNHAAGAAIIGRVTATQGIRIADGDISNCRVVDNVIRGAPTSLFHNPAHGAVFFRLNDGYVTENSGTATVPNGAVQVVVNHGLATTPTRVLLTSRGWGAADKAWVTNLTATQFTINVDVNPGAATAIFDWRAQMGEG